MVKNNSFEISAWGRQHKVWFTTNKYVADDSICVELYTDEEPYARLTVCLDDKGIGGTEYAYFDINNCGNLYNQMISKGVIVPTGFGKQSGMVNYPLVKWNMDFIREHEVKFGE